MQLGQQSQPIKPKKSRWKFWVSMILFLPLIMFILYTWFSLTWSYSSGQRAGYVQKLSKKGFIVKTWEGELAMVSMPGTLPEIFSFTVREDSVAARINNSLGRRVRLSYEQHVNVPTRFFGETEYFVTHVDVVE